MRKFVIPLLCYIKIDDLPEPIRDRNAVDASKREHILQMLKTIGEKLNIKQSSDTKYNKYVESLLQAVSEKTFPQELTDEKSIENAISAAEKLSELTSQTQKQIKTLNGKERKFVEDWVWHILRFESGRLKIFSFLMGFLDMRGDSKGQDVIWKFFRESLEKQLFSINDFESFSEHFGRNLVGKVNLDIFPHLTELLSTKKILLKRMQLIQRPHVKKEYEKLTELAMKVQHIQRQAHTFAVGLREHLE